jgi:DNA-binding NarL/FixJ family response regulator
MHVLLLDPGIAGRETASLLGQPTLEAATADQALDLLVRFPVDTVICGEAHAEELVATLDRIHALHRVATWVVAPRTAVESTRDLLEAGASGWIPSDATPWELRLTFAPRSAWRSAA